MSEEKIIIGGHELVSVLEWKKQDDNSQTAKGQHYKFRIYPIGGGYNLELHDPSASWDNVLLCCGAGATVLGTFVHESVVKGVAEIMNSNL